MKIINVRGSNASGKSTAVKKYIEGYSQKVIELNGNYVTYVKEIDAYVIGRYDCTSPGCDRYKSFDDVFEQIVFLLKTEQPELIIYEGMLISKEFKRTYLLSRVAAKYGYEFYCVVLVRDFFNVIKLLEKRNNGREYNSANVMRTYESVLSCAQRLKEKGVRVVEVNPDHYKEDEMKKILEGVINGQRN